MLYLYQRHDMLRLMPCCILLSPCYAGKACQFYAIYFFFASADLPVTPRLLPLPTLMTRMPQASCHCLPPPLPPLLIRHAELLLRYFRSALR